MPANVGYPAITDTTALQLQRAETPASLQAAPENNVSRVETSPALDRPEAIRRPEPAERREGNLGNNVDVFA